MPLLAGLRVVVTRAVHQADELARPLRERGATAILLPVIGIAPPENPAPLARAVQQIADYDWIIFTSVNAIRALGKHRCRAHVATVGAATRDFARGQGWTVSVTPETYVAEALLDAMGTFDLRGTRILIPSAAVTRDLVPEELTRRGAAVDVVVAYRNVIPAEAAQAAKEVFQLPCPDWITFASSSAVENLVKLVPVETLRQSKIASIGPVTSQTVRQAGLHVHAEPAEHTIDGLVEAIVQAVAPKTD